MTKSLMKKMKELLAYSLVIMLVVTSFDMRVLANEPTEGNSSVEETNDQNISEGQEENDDQNINEGQEGNDDQNINEGQEGNDDQNIDEGQEGNDDQNIDEGQEGNDDQNIDEGEEDNNNQNENDEQGEAEVGDFIKTNGAVTLTAEPEVFPENAILSVREANENELANINALVETHRAENRTLEASYTYQINVIDENEQQINANTEKGSAAVNFTLPETENEELEVRVYQIQNYEVTVLNATVEDGVITVAYTDGVYYHIEYTKEAEEEEQPAVTIGNHGYPYGTNMGDGITFHIDVTVDSETEVTYQWKYEPASAFGQVDDGARTCSGKSGTLAAETTKITTTFSGSELTNSAVYWCEFSDGSATTPIMIIKNESRCYISNGQMAYSIFNERGFLAFDIMGKYCGSWVTRTSYDGYWNWYTSSEANPQKITVQSTGPSSNPSLAENKVYFLENDFAGTEDYTDNVKVHMVLFESTLAAGQHALAFGCDVMIRRNDAAPTTAVLDRELESRLVQLQLVDTNGNLEDASDEDAALVVKTYDNIFESPKYPTHFYVGGWSPRFNFAFNKGENDSGSKKTLDNGIVYEVQGADSGASVSWTNLEENATVCYAFGIGKVSQTGAKTSGSVDYEAETLEGLAPNKNYQISVVENGAVVETYYFTTGANQNNVPLEGNDKEGTPYSFLGKNVIIQEVVNGVAGEASDPLEIAGRPIAEDAAVNGNVDSVVDKPYKVKENEIEVTPTSIVLKFTEPGEDATEEEIESYEKKLAQEYRIIKQNEASEWIKPGTYNHMVAFTNLDPSTEYTIVARIPATSYSPASGITEGILAKTLEQIEFAEPEEGLTFDFTGEEIEYPGIITATAGAEISYSINEYNTYSATKPSITKGGKHTVYYRITKEGAKTEYGQYDVIVNPALVYEANGGTLPEDTNTRFVIAYNAYIPEEGQIPEPEKTNFEFTGWYTNKSLTTLWKFDEMRMTEDVTLYAGFKPKEAEPILIKVEDENEDFDVESIVLTKGDTRYAAELLEDGNYTIDGSLPDGEYVLKTTLVGRDGRTRKVITKNVVIANGKIKGQANQEVTVNIPSKNAFYQTEGKKEVGVTNSVLDTTKAESEGLDQVAMNSHDENTKIVDVKLTVESQKDISQMEEADFENDPERKEIWKGQNSIQSESTTENVEFLDMSIEKVTVNNATEEQTTAKVRDTEEEGNTVLEICIPFETRDKKNIKVYRHHFANELDEVGETMEFTRVKTRQTKDEVYYKDGYFFVDSEHDCLYIYASKFSTYAVGFDTGEDNFDKSNNSETYTYSRPHYPYYPYIVLTNVETKADDAEEENAEENAEGTTEEITETEETAENGTESKPNKNVTANGYTKYENQIFINKSLKVTQTGSKVTVTWSKVPGADGYKVFATYCGTSFDKKHPNQIVGKNTISVTIKKINGKKLDLTKHYKFYVVAYKKVNGKEKQLGKSITAHIAGRKNSSCTNAKNVKLQKKSITLSVGKTAKIRATVILVDPKKAELSEGHTAHLRFASDNRKVVKVDKNGKITALKKGTCKVYVYAKNGCTKAVTVTVK